METQDEADALAYVRAHAAHLVPPASPLLTAVLSSALPSPSRPLTPIPIGHHERNIDFWDERRAAEWEAERARDDKWEMTRAQVNELKRAHREWAEAVKTVREEGEGLEGLPPSWAFPPRLSDDFVLSRRQKNAWTAGMPAFEPRQAIASLVGPPPKDILPEADDALLAMDAPPNFDEAFELKLTATAEEFAEVKRIRQQLTGRAQLEGYRREDDEAWQKELARIPSLSIPRLGSPPIFPRAPSNAVTLKHLERDPFGGFLPSERSDYPSSPRGPGITQEQWNKEEGLTPLPLSSPRRSPPVGPRPPPPIWSSSPSKLPPQMTLEPERPRFDRASQKAIPTVRGFDASCLADLLKGDGDETDQLDMSEGDETDQLDMSEGDEPDLVTPSAILQHALASDDTLGEPAPKSGEALSIKRIKPPKLTTPSASLPAATLPQLSAFASSTAPTGSPWALKPLPGLRALTLDLSWQAWTLPLGETVESVAGGDGGERDGLAEREELAAVEQAREALLCGATEDDWDVGASAALVDARGDDEEQLVPRVRAAGGLEVDVDVEGGTASDETTLLVERRASTFEALPHSGALAAADHGQSMEELCPRTNPSPNAIAAFTAPRVPSKVPVQSGVHAPSSDSSDFGFIFPLASPPSPPTRRAAAAADGDATVTSHETRLEACHAHTPSSSPLVEAEEPLPRFEKADLARPSWSNATALDRFLTLRGKSVPSTSAPAPSRAGAVAPPDRVQPAAPHSSPPPGSIPFTLPPFLATTAGTERSGSAPARVIAFDELFQMRAHLAALQDHSLIPVHRPSRSPPDANRTHEPHLIVDPRSAVLFLRLDALIGNAVRPDQGEGPLKRPEAIFTTLERLSTRFDRLLVVLEETAQRVGRVKRYAYTPPVLIALEQLAGALRGLNGGAHGVEVALSKGPEHSAELARRWVDFLRAEEEAKCEEEGLPVLELWGVRDWLSEDPSQDETTLLELDGLNELAACAVLGVCSANDFLGLSTEDRAAVFSRVLGAERVDRISRFISAFRPGTLLSPSSSSGGHDYSALPISQVGAMDDDMPASSGGSSEGWKQWVDLTLSPE